MNPEEKIIFACQKRIIEAEAQQKIGEALQDGLLQALRKDKLRGVNIEEFVDMICDTLAADLSMRNDALKAFHAEVSPKTVN